jgi:D-alanyl-D-alanine-carboxypeptidase/D-alanyl-D-alanine-endopeptidase
MLSLVHGSPWDSLVTKMVTEPLGMKDTMMVPQEDMRKRLAPPYSDKTPGNEWNFKALAGAGALRSTAADLMIFGQAMIEPDKTPIADAIRNMMKVHAPFPIAGGDIGLGVIIGKLDGESDYIHSGGTGGYRSVLQVIPAKKSVRVVLINNDILPAEVVLLGVRENKKPDSAEAVTLTEAQLDTYTGIYAMGPTERFTILRRGSVLHVRLTGQPFFPVKPVANDRFRFDVVDADLQFVKEDGVVKSVTLFQNGREIPAARTNDPLPVVLFPSSEELAPYLGKYEFGPGGIFTVSQHSNTLYLQLTGQLAFPAFQTKKDYFELDVVKAALEFKKDADGKVTGFTFYQNGVHQARKQ